MTFYDWTVTIGGVDVSQFVIAGGTIDSGRPSFFTDFQAPRAVFDFRTPLGWPQYTGEWPEVDYDMPVIIHVTWDGTTQWRRFTGKVQAIDLGVYAHRVTCVHEVADLDYVTSGGTGEFYVRLKEPDYQRVPWLVSEASSDITINVVGTKGRWVNRVAPGTRATPLLPQLLSLASDCDARLRGTRLGAIDYRLRVWDRPARYTLPATVVERDGIEISRERGLVRTVAEVTYGEPDPDTGVQAYVTTQNTPLQAVFGDRVEQITTNLSYAVGAQGRGNKFLTDHADTYHAPDVTLIMSRATGPQADAILALDDDYPIRLTPLPASFPITTYDADVIGTTEVMHQEDFRLILHLSPGAPSSDEDDGNWVEDGTITGGDETGTSVVDGRVYRWHKFNEDTTSTLTVPDDVSVVADLLVVAGGGGGGSGSLSWDGGHGGAGAAYLGSFALEAGTYSPVVGSGGAGGYPGANGDNSVFENVICYGGGGGGGTPNNGGLKEGQPGGSGGGGGMPSGPGGAATYGSTDGGLTTNSTDILGTNGQAGNTSYAGAGGGADLSSAITGTTVVYARPGGLGSTTPGSGGTHGGYYSAAGASGQPGVVILSYPVTPGGGAGTAYVYDEDIPYDTAITYEEA